MRSPARKLSRLTFRHFSLLLVLAISGCKNPFSTPDAPLVLYKVLSKTQASLIERGSISCLEQRADTTILDSLAKNGFERDSIGWMKGDPVAWYRIASNFADEHAECFISYFATTGNLVTNIQVARAGNNKNAGKEFSKDSSPQKSDRFVLPDSQFETTFSGSIDTVARDPFDNRYIFMTGIKGKHKGQIGFYNSRLEKLTLSGQSDTISQVFGRGFKIIQKMSIQKDASSFKVNTIAQFNGRNDSVSNGFMEEGLIVLSCNHSIIAIDLHGKNPLGDVYFAKFDKNGMPESDLETKDALKIAKRAFSLRFFKSASHKDYRGGV